MKDWCLEVWGDYACFTRPEMKVERVSYDVITPSARAQYLKLFSGSLHKLNAHNADRGVKTNQMDICATK